MGEDQITARRQPGPFDSLPLGLLDEGLKPGPRVRFALPGRQPTEPRHGRVEPGTLRPFGGLGTLKLLPRRAERYLRGADPFVEGADLGVGLGELLASRTGIPVVLDLRAADVAAGGQGAPLVPVYHRALASNLSERPVAFVNIGGVANMTWIGQEGELVAFDTGPGNALINDWCERHTDVSFDRDGVLASRGHVAADALRQLLKNNFFATAAPKSLDRNAFDSSLLDGLSPEDGAATLTRFTAATIAGSAKLVPDAPRLYIICGGGRLNSTLMQDLRNLLQVDVIVAENVGFNGDSMEAEAWAYLAVRCLRGLPITFPGTTGAPRPLPAGVLTKAE